MTGPLTDQEQGEVANLIEGLKQTVRTWRAECLHYGPPLRPIEVGESVFLLCVLCEQPINEE